jgi:sulfocyanin
MRQVNSYFSYDSTARMARLTIVASSDTSNLTLNYNGTSGGRLEVEVPTSWTLQVRMVNAGELRHSALVIEQAGELPIVPKHPVFSGSSIEPAEAGLAPMQQGSMQFVASRSGSYPVVCGVPAHAQLGMWVKLIVRDDTALPRYRVLPPTKKELSSAEK